MTNNLELWDKVCKTNPDHTKPAGRFTAIDAYQQIRAATEQFGPVGDGWGWKVQSEQITDGNAIVRISLWWKQGKKGGEFDEYGTAIVSRMKDESFKAALTDSITKGLSRLGFNADVFMGKFDNNKYVAERKREVAAANNLTDQEKAADNQARHQEFIDHVLPEIDSIENMEELQKKFSDMKDALNLMKHEAPDLYAEARDAILNTQNRFIVTEGHDENKVAE